jgi:tRNA(fMet)-specific endonuclease VapC
VTRYLLDTNAASGWIDRVPGLVTRVRAAVSKGSRVGVAMPVLGELFAGVELSRRSELNRKRLRRALATLAIWPFDLAAAEEYGRVFAELRRAGRPIQQIDIQIAAIARSLGGCTVISADADLRRVPRLSVEDWTTPELGEAR